MKKFILFITIILLFLNCQVAVGQSNDDQPPGSQPGSSNDHLLFMLPNVGGHFSDNINAMACANHEFEQVIANLLDNAISFSSDHQKIEIDLTETSNNFVMTIKDQGPGFNEASPQKIFKRFYSNRPSKFGEHSGLGLNIAKNIVELHKGAIAASNRINQKGAQVEVLLPKILS